MKLRSKPNLCVVIRQMEHTTMNRMIRLIAMLLLSASAAQGSESVAKQFLRYVYGEDGIELVDICHPSEDAWMLRGAKNTNALAALDSLKIESKPKGITSGMVGKDIYFLELRDGKVDPAFNLDGIFMMHRQLVLRFVFASLSQNREMLGRLATDASKVKIDGPKPATRELGQYGSIIEQMPVVRSSNPADDAKSRTVTYRVPIGDDALMLTLLKMAAPGRLIHPGQFMWSFSFEVDESIERPHRCTASV
jgi:hypothetical protein